jgi:hypothetical protein
VAIIGVAILTFNDAGYADVCHKIISSSSLLKLRGKGFLLTGPVSESKFEDLWA